MARPVRVKVEGFEDLHKSLAELSRAAGNSVLRRSGVKAMEPMRALAQSLAPDDMKSPDPDLESSIVISAGANLARQGRRALGEVEKGNRVNISMGPDAKLPRSPTQGKKSSGYTRALVAEFGSRQQAPQPYMRPAFDRDKDALLTRLAAILRVEIERAIGRAQRRAARAAAKRSTGG